MTLPTPGEDPAVLTWRIALAPRPRYSMNGKHWWRDLVTETFRAARDARDALRESGTGDGWRTAGAAGASVGYHQLSDEEFNKLHPAPLLKDFLVGLSQGRVAPDHVEPVPRQNGKNARRGAA